MPSSPEVHVLDDEVDGFAREQVDAGRGRVRAEDARAVHGQQHIEGRAHGLTVVYDEYRAIAQTVLKSLVLLVLHQFGCGVCGNGCKATHSLDRSARNGG